MITTKNKGILAAIKELKTIGLTNILREEYEYRLKVKRDTRARESYVRKEGIAIGKAEGKAEDILELLEELGIAPEEIEQKIRSEMNLELLTKWHKLAAKAGSMEEFIEKM